MNGRQEYVNWRRSCVYKKESHSAGNTEGDSTRVIGEPSVEPESDDENTDQDMVDSNILKTGT